MTNAHSSPLFALVSASLGSARAETLLGTIEIHPTLLGSTSVTRGVLAEALAVVLFDGLLAQVPEGRAYVDDVIRDGQRVRFDHGALRTVLAPCGALPSGIAAFTRILEPLGYRQNGTYPLAAIKMTGRSYAHEDFPEDIPQYFVSELHPERFSEGFQRIVAEIVGGSVDPLTEAAARSLDRLQAERALPFEEAAALLPVLVGCFARQHGTPSEEGYELLLRESAEMAWIATEGNVFNHATDRVDDLTALAEGQRQLGRSIKDAIEVSRSGRVRQTAFRAAQVQRTFRAADGREIVRTVPGSFYEFIARDRIHDSVTGTSKLDLSFDSSNAQGIFKMTATG